MQNTHLVIIDPQNDFTDPSGTLYVQDAEHDMDRLAKFVDEKGDKIQSISVTLDSHHPFDIAHPGFWKDSSGTNPTPMTIISADDVKNGIWTPVRPGLQKYCEDYTGKLSSNGRYPLMIWPVHCMIGSWGANIYPSLFQALNEWALKHSTTINYVTKGSNVYTEHYSAIKADVPHPKDPSTNLNTRFIQEIENCDNILIAGEASSHCVMYTVKDIVDEFDDNNLSKLILLTDAMSSVQVPPPAPDFPALAQQFIQEMKMRGLRLSTTDQWLGSQSLKA